MADDAPKLGLGPWISLVAAPLFFFGVYFGAVVGHGTKIALGALFGSYFLYDGLKDVWAFVQARRRYRNARQPGMNGS
ncbi:hypothetical protein [Sphingomonas koreensis]|uniref:hypothetical protein n=1 Tax=Sphingomonas koreensis TaxID=93064 RepID=UPI000F7E8C03|nr:hypothetical protein [Sphingomonas koreensis]